MTAIPTADTAIWKAIRQRIPVLVLSVGIMITLTLGILIGIKCISLIQSDLRQEKESESDRAYVGRYAPYCYEKFDQTSGSSDLICWRFDTVDGSYEQADVEQ